MEAIPAEDDEDNQTRIKEQSTVSLGSSPDSGEKLVLWQGVALLTADCLGVGVLALPNDVKVLGFGLGLGFLIANFPVNYYAGDLLSVIALSLEQSTEAEGHGGDDDSNHDLKLESEDHIELPAIQTNVSPTMTHRKVSPSAQTSPSENSPEVSSRSEAEDVFHDEELEDRDVLEHGVITIDRHESIDHKSGPTYDLIGMSNAVFESPWITKIVVCIYYLNLFLVLGDYILVMARAVSAMFLDEICIPTAGILASIFMFGVCQLRTMALLGRNVSLASLLAMLIVLLQCLFHHRNSARAVPMDAVEAEEVIDIWAKFSAFASIGFAVGSQKLFLNIRHELRHKEEASKVLAGSLTTYGTAYLAVIVLAGSNPPSFLFDAIPEGFGRRVAGLLLWGHVAVSYAINSQALCSSIERFLLSAGSTASSPSWFVRTTPRIRWLLLTLAVSVSSYLVSNAVPFFKDLVALIGALTSVPLTLTLPALLHRQFQSFPVLWPTPQTTGSYSLFLYSIVFLAIGLIGALSSIDEDWLNQGTPFACR